MLTRTLKLTVLGVMTVAIVDVAASAPARERVRDRDQNKAVQPQGQGRIGATNAQGAREAYVNTLYGKLQNRNLAEILQEIYLRPEKVENDPAAIKGVERLVDLIRKHESQGKNVDEAVELALRELRPDLKLTSKDLIEACR